MWCGLIVFLRVYILLHYQTSNLQILVKARWSKPSSLSEEDIVDLQPPDMGIESLRSDSNFIIE